MKVRAMLAALLLLIPAAALARDTEHVYSINAALQTKLAKERLLEVPFFFAGQHHPAVASSLGEWQTKKTTRGAFRSDQEACQVALLSGIIQLQKRAVKQGASAIVDIESITMAQPLASATEYRCVAGSVVVHVSLKGRLVKLHR